MTLQWDPSIPLAEASIGPLFSWKPSNHLPPWASGAACHRSLERHSRCIHLPSIRGWMNTISPVRVISKLENRLLLFNAHFGFVNNWIFTTVALSLVSKDHLIPVAPAAEPWCNFYAYHLQALLWASSAGCKSSHFNSLVRMDFTIQFHNLRVHWQQQDVTNDQKKKKNVPVTHFCCVSFFSPRLAFHGLGGWFCQSRFRHIRLVIIWMLLFALY